MTCRPLVCASLATVTEVGASPLGQFLDLCDHLRMVGGDIHRLGNVLIQVVKPYGDFPGWRVATLGHCASQVEFPGAMTDRLELVTKVVIECLVRCCCPSLLEQDR